MALAVLLLVFFTAACEPGAPAPNLVVVTLDTTRADHLGLHGYFRDTSPNLDAFAAGAIVFDRALVPIATTLPTHVSIFTGTQPLEHGVVANAAADGRRFAPAAGLRPLAEVVRSAGWRTAAFVSAAPLKRGSGIENGFEHFDEPAGEERDAEATTRAALAWLASTARAPYFLWVHYFDAHWPYTPPPPYATLFGAQPELEAMIAERQIPRIVFRPIPRAFEETRASINLYDGELRFQDSQMGKLLAALEARNDWEHTTVVIMGDHGEGIGQHGIAAHGEAWDEQLHVPLVMRVPGRTGRRVATLATAVDVLPTLVGLLELPALEPLRFQSSGRDLLAAGAASLPILSQTQDIWMRSAANEHRLALTSERWKLFRVERADAPARYELFDLASDPFELTDVAARHPDVVEQLGAAIEVARSAQQRKAIALRGHEGPRFVAPDPALVEQLRALGYLEGKVTDTPTR